MRSVVDFVELARRHAPKIAKLVKKLDSLEPEEAFRLLRDKRGEIFKDWPPQLVPSLLGAGGEAEIAGMCAQLVHGCTGCSLGLLHARGADMGGSTTYHRVEALADAARRAGLGRGHVMLQHEVVTVLLPDHVGIAELLKLFKEYVQLSLYGIALLSSRLRATCATLRGSPPFVVCLTSRTLECASPNILTMLDSVSDRSPIVTYHYYYLIIILMLVSAFAERTEINEGALETAYDVSRGRGGRGTGSGRAPARAAMASRAANRAAWREERARAAETKRRDSEAVLVKEQQSHAAFDAATAAFKLQALQMALGACPHIYIKRARELAEAGDAAAAYAMAKHGAELAAESEATPSERVAFCGRLPRELWFSCATRDCPNMLDGRCTLQLNPTQLDDGVLLFDEVRVRCGRCSLRQNVKNLSASTAGRRFRASICKLYGYRNVNEKGESNEQHTTLTGGLASALATYGAGASPPRPQLPPS
jgi:hypothetical protein